MQPACLHAETTCEQCKHQHSILPDPGTASPPKPQAPAVQSATKPCKGTTGQWQSAHRALAAAGHHPLRDRQACLTRSDPMLRYNADACDLAAAACRCLPLYMPGLYEAHLTAACTAIPHETPLHTQAAALPDSALACHHARQHPARTSVLPLNNVPNTGH